MEHDPLATPMRTPALRNLQLEIDGDVAVLRFNRPEKRNAINDETIKALGDFFAQRPEQVKAVVLTAVGENFSAGLDLSEHRHRDAAEVMLHSRMWHRVLNTVQFGVPVVCVMKGAVIGGGLEIAAATHVRVAEEGAFYTLPEAARGIYTGGGASVRVARIIGPGRMIEIMLTGRVYDTKEGQHLGISHYVVAKGHGDTLGLELAKKLARNAPLSNYAILNAIPHITDMSANDGFFAEALVAALVQTGKDARKGLDDFLEKRAPRVRPTGHDVESHRG
jgi:(methylthio)acryloyl-CoA hydratase